MWRAIPTPALLAVTLLSCGEPYQVWIEVDEEAISIWAKTAGDECCARWESFDSCGEVDDVTPPCEECEHCVEVYSVRAGGEEVFRAATPSLSWWPSVSGQHGQASGTRMEVVIEGCHGTLRVPIDVPAPRDPLPSIEVGSAVGGRLEVTWSPSGVGDHSCAELASWHGTSWCCGPDSGRAEVASVGPLGIEIRASVVRLWRADDPTTGVTSWQRQVSTVSGL